MSGDGSTHGDGSTSGGDASSKNHDGSTSGGDGSTSMGDGSTSGGDGSTSGGDGGGTGCGPREICGDGVDNNCNGQADENCPCVPGSTQHCYDGPPSQAGRGVCNLGTQTCMGDGEFGMWSACMGAGHPQNVVCGTGMDYRCDGMTDEGCECTPGAMQSCYSGPAGTAGVGVCHAGSQTCMMTDSGSAWGPCTGDVVPSPELCDGMDHDCDGTANSGCTCVLGAMRSCYDGPAGTNGVGLCHAGSQTCVMSAGGMGVEWGACTGEVTPAANTCDGVDRACDGNPMGTCPCLVGQTRTCYTGPAGTSGVGICHGGTEACTAMGSSANWSGACNGQVTPATEVCGNGIDDNCNGTVDEGCIGMVTCPGNQTVPAGSPVTLNATGMGLSNFSWTITSAPTGGASTAVWAPTPPTSATETFTPYIVGVYTIQVTARDAHGNTVMCSFTVTAEPHGLRVQLTWNGTGDVDLHLHDGNSTPWFNIPDDAFYSNRTPAWGASQDFDNTTANGPENTVVNTPVVGMSYTIGVHNYANAAGRQATVQIFCGTTMGTTPTATYTSRALNGTAAGNCTANDFWKVARVVFTSATACTITPINTYVASSSACSAL